MPSVYSDNKPWFLKKKMLENYEHAKVYEYFVFIISCVFLVKLTNGLNIFLPIHHSFTFSRPLLMKLIVIVYISFYLKYIYQKMGTLNTCVHSYMWSTLCRYSGDSREGRVIGHELSPFHLWPVFICINICIELRSRG